MPAAKMAALARRALRSVFLPRPPPPLASWGARRGLRALKRTPLRVFPPRVQEKKQPGLQAAPSLSKKPPRQTGSQRKEEPIEPELRYERAGPGDKRLR